jgi:hypothetical protein
MEDGSPASLSARLRLLRIAMRRRRGASVSLIKLFLTDSDERIMRMSAREIMRRKPADYENLLLKMMTSATPSVRRVIGRAIGGAGFDNFWQRFDKLDKSTRKQAGKAMLKLLPDAIQRLHRFAPARAQQGGDRSGRNPKRSQRFAGGTAHERHRCPCARQCSRGS